MDRNELYHIVGLFLLAMMTLTSDFSSLTFPASIFGSIAFFISFAVMILAPSYVIADAVVGLTQR
ncbi:hypothetical protein [Haloprofundus salinisoli]|uniref:hypothetical protein n=1 Tax=Haloprofundus salinisoli TaxID=2876193 RepID=UPI001CCBE0F5|nr:hypothetical protein [Haloprofundus salinisoli]